MQQGHIISNRAGKSNVKEQYAIFYNDRATLDDRYDWTDDYQDDCERPPFQATFTVEGWTFTLFTMHTDPDVVDEELTCFEEIVGNPESDTIILGDLNADGTYYDEDNIEHFTDWHWGITNDMDTTEAANDYTYDRIIFNDGVENNFIRVGIMDDVVSEQSDHYLVYGIFDPDESSEQPPAEPSEDYLLINEFELNPEGTDSGNEWVELFNPTDNTINLDGWILRNNDGNDHALSGTISSNDYIEIIFSGAWLDNSDERVLLFDPSSQEIDSTPIKADSDNNDNTWSRVPNGEDTDSDGDWTLKINTCGFSNTETEEPSSGHLLINEFDLNPTGTDNGIEWVELFNPTSNSIDMTGWYLKNNDDGTHFISGSIGPGEYEVITFNSQWLDNSDERVILLNPSSQEIDIIPIKDDGSDDNNSWQRVPNGEDTDLDDDWTFQSNTKGNSNS